MRFVHYKTSSQKNFIASRATASITRIFGPNAFQVCQSIFLGDIHLTKKIIMKSITIPIMLESNTRNTSAISIHLYSNSAAQIIVDCAKMVADHCMGTRGRAELKTLQVLHLVLLLNTEGWLLDNQKYIP